VRNNERMARLLLSTVLSVAAFAQHSQQPYLISIGAESSTVPSGTIWLYSLSGYGVHSVKLSRIENGRALMPADFEEAKRELNPNQTANLYVLAIQVGEHLWYRTPNISPEVIWTDLAGRVNSLGQSTVLPSGETRLILPLPSNRRITMLYPDGRPAASADVQVSVYFYDMGHCGGHQGLPLGTFRTDQKGTFTVTAPLVSLYLDNITYFEDEGSGPAGKAYSYNTGMKLPSDERLTLKEAWELTGDDYLTDEFELHVLTTTGKPTPGVEIYEDHRTNQICGGHDHPGTTDSHGTAKIALIAGTISALTLVRPDGQERALTTPELHSLFTHHKLTLRW
jgi:hypothetical protein